MSPTNSSLPASTPISAICPLSCPQHSIIICRHLQYVFTPPVKIKNTNRWTALVSICSTLPLEPTSWIIPRTLSASFIRCLTVLLPWSCQITVFIEVTTVTVYHHFSLSLQTKTLLFYKSLPSTIVPLIGHPWTNFTETWPAHRLFVLVILRYIICQFLIFVSGGG